MIAAAGRGWVLLVAWVRVRVPRQIAEPTILSKAPAQRGALPRMSSPRSPGGGSWASRVRRWNKSKTVQPARELAADGGFSFRASGCARARTPLGQVRLRSELDRSALDLAVAELRRPPYLFRPGGDIRLLTFLYVSMATRLRIARRSFALLGGLSIVTAAAPGAGRSGPFRATVLAAAARARGPDWAALLPPSRRGGVHPPSHSDGSARRYGGRRLADAAFGAGRRIV